ncbi:hypothetical protein AN664_0224305 [Serratia marcescens]|nr:hypothetical protein AN664_0224305 [Serratia marcescens]
MSVNMHLKMQIHCLLIPAQQKSQENVGNWLGDLFRSRYNRALMHHIQQLKEMLAMVWGPFLVAVEIAMLVPITSLIRLLSNNVHRTAEFRIM